MATQPVSSLVTQWESFKKTASPPPKPLGNSITTDPGISGQPKPKSLNQRGRSISANPPQKKQFSEEILNFKRSSPPVEIHIPNPLSPATENSTTKKPVRSISLSPQILTRKVLDYVNKEKSLNSELMRPSTPAIHEYKQSPDKAKSKMKGKWENEKAENEENLEVLKKVLVVVDKYCRARLEKRSAKFEKMSEDIHAKLETLVSSTLTAFNAAAKQTKKDCFSDSLTIKREQGIVPKWQYMIEDSLEKLNTLNLIIDKTGECCGKEEITSAFPFVSINSTLHKNLNDLVKSTLSQFEDTIIGTQVALQYLDICKLQEQSLDIFFNQVRDFITNMQDLYDSLNEKDVYIVINQKKEKKIQEELLKALDELLKKNNIWMKKSMDDFKKGLHSDRQSIVQTFLLLKDYFKAVRHLGKVYIDHVGYKPASVMQNGEEYYSPKEKAKEKNRRPATAFLWGISREMSQFWDIMEKGIKQAKEIVEMRKRLGFPFFVEITLHDEFQYLQDKVLKTFQEEINRSSILYKQKMSGNLQMHKKV